MQMYISLKILKSSAKTETDMTADTNAIFGAVSYSVANINAKDFIGRLPEINDWSRFRTAAITFKNGICERNSVFEFCNVN